jgi:hypothetical protein
MSGAVMKRFVLITVFLSFTLVVSCDDKDGSTKVNDLESEPLDEETNEDVDVPFEADEIVEEKTDEDAENIANTEKWIKQWGTIGADYGYFVAVDESGNIFVTGRTNNSFEGYANKGYYDIFLTKWNSEGTNEWTKQWGTVETEGGYSVTTDIDGSIFVAGHTNGSFDENINLGNNDVFLTKWNSDGKKEWTKQWGTGESDYGHSVIVDSSGNIFVAGCTKGAFADSTNSGDNDVFLTKWNSGGTREWTRQIGTSGDDCGNSVAVDAIGNIFVTGYTMGSLDGNVNDGDYDAFLTKWNSEGTREWTKQLGTVGNDYGYGVAVDRDENILVTGYTEGSLNGNKNTGKSDIFLTKWNSDGTEIWTKQWGTTSEEYGVSVEAKGVNIFVVGITNGPLDGNISNGSGNTFLTKLDTDGNAEYIKQWGTTENDWGLSVAVDHIDNIFILGNTLGTFEDNINSGGNDIFLIKWNEF